MTDFLADESLYPVIVEVYRLLLRLPGNHFLHLTDHMASGKSAYQQSRTTACPVDY